ncbi:hypothetical protein [Peribacillus frigoritolerans]|uniref:hypothetical protein n=1 Tax=Peribacillus frigoritolerans TaxID=450367 RepID=UPI0020BFD3FC|nr:hypothetical protein [Peribacillus frigoritolerans]
MKVAVESYKINDLIVSAELESGHSTREVTTNVTSITRDFPKGSYVFDMAQPYANFMSPAR